jgi:hypothetical protein
MTMECLQEDLQTISDYVKNQLECYDHKLAPGNERLQTPDNGLVFYPINNTKSGDDVGVQSYKAKLWDLCTNSPSVSMPVSIALIKLQDKLTALASPLSITDSPMCLQVREKHNSLLGQMKTDALQHLDWRDVQDLYREGLEPGETYNEHHLHVLVDFMDLQGVVMHYNTTGLTDLVIIDQVWLIKQLTRVIRDPQLHCVETNGFIDPVAFDDLYQRGMGRSIQARGRLSRSYRIA